MTCMAARKIETIEHRSAQTTEDRSLQLKWPVRSIIMFRMFTLFAKETMVGRSA